MFQGKRVIAAFLFWVFTSAAMAGQTTHAISVTNRSEYPIYVWVTVAENVTVPSATSLPYLSLAIVPSGSGKIYFSYTRAWDNQTKLTLKFSTVESPSALNAVGQFSEFSMVPNSPSEAKWRIEKVWSGLVFPYIVTDNIYELNKVTWNRDTDFPITITFQGKKKQNNFYNTQANN